MVVPADGEISDAIGELLEQLRARLAIHDLRANMVKGARYVTAIAAQPERESSNRHDADQDGHWANSLGE